MDESRETVEAAFAKLILDERLRLYVDQRLPIPEVFDCRGQAKLILLGQDPTVANAESRRQIKVVLNLNRGGGLRNYAQQICDGLGISLENVYATNLLKNFFVRPPTKLDDKTALLHE